MTFQFRFKNDQLPEPIGEGDSMLNIYKLFFPLFTRFFMVGYRIHNCR